VRGRFIPPSTFNLSIKGEKNKMGRQASPDTIFSLKKQLKEAMRAITELQKNKSTETTVVQASDDRDVLVVSLYDGILNLSTEGFGKGENYSFTYFGEEITIPFNDLRKIIRKEKKRIIQGLIYIDDPEIIKSERLTAAYKKILSKEKIEELFMKSQKLFKESFDEMTDGQKEVFSQLIVSKLIGGKEVDMNIVSMVSKAVGKELKEIADFTISLKTAANE
jgi:hypothetical protein